MLKRLQIKTTPHSSKLKYTMMAFTFTGDKKSVDNSIWSSAFLTSRDESDWLFVQHAFKREFCKTI